MMDDEEGEFCILVNNWQYSLWLTFADVPAGEDVVPADPSQQEGLDLPEETWTYTRPASLAQAMDADPDSR